MLRSFVPLFVMTFFICLFIVLMQFLWRFIDDLVGKGLDFSVIAELFFYAALTMIPMALPLAILLASLMTFGNLGERFELTAMKASGVSLLKCMRPLIALILLIATGAFFFQNDILPLAQTKMWTLLYSMRQKSPELEIPEGVFYDQIPGYNLFVKQKSRKDGTLYDVMIYDMSRGFDNASIILADSGKLAITEDKTHLFLNLWNGESFENLKDAGGSVKNVPYRRESFDNKEILVKFDANFNRMDEEGMRNQYVGKNISQLQATIDSVNQRVDSLGGTYSRLVSRNPFFGLSYFRQQKGEDGELKEIRAEDVEMTEPLDIDSVFRGKTSGYTLNYLNLALSKAKRLKQDYEFKSLSLADDKKNIRRHMIELEKKFTLSIACMIFFFIGAPLGAIIRKGGLGTPLVISVILFIIYYIIDNTGYKMARDGHINVSAGVWLSTFILLPLGILFTYKAVNDSAVFNADSYLNFFRKFLGWNEVRKIAMKEIVMEEVDSDTAVEKLQQLNSQAAELISLCQEKENYADYWLKGYGRSRIKSLSESLELTVDYLSNSQSKMLILKLMDYPILRDLWLYQPGGIKWIGILGMVLFPIGFPIYLFGRKTQKVLMSEVRSIMRVSDEIIGIIERENN